MFKLNWTLLDVTSILWISNKRGVFLILFEKIFPTPHFFTYTNEKKSQLHDFSPTYVSGNNVPTPRLFQLKLLLESSEYLRNVRQPFPEDFLMFYLVQHIQTTNPEFHNFFQLIVCLFIFEFFLWGKSFQLK